MLPFCGLAYHRALIVRIGFWGILYSTYNKEPLKDYIVDHQGPCVGVLVCRIENFHKDSTKDQEWFRV